MPTQDERISLKQEELPLDLTPLNKAVLIDYVTNCPADQVLNCIILIDDQIDRLQQALTPFIQKMMEQRQTLLNRALVEGIKENPGAVLVEKKGRKVRNEISDLEAFELAFPDGYKEIRAEQERLLDLEYQKEKAGLPESKINLTLADAKVGKDRVTAFVGEKPVAITYEVRKV